MNITLLILYLRSNQRSVDKAKSAPPRLLQARCEIEKQVDAPSTYPRQSALQPGVYTSLLPLVGQHVIAKVKGTDCVHSVSYDLYLLGMNNSRRDFCQADVSSETPSL